MIENDIVEAVIGLAHGLFYNSGMEAVVLVLNTNKPAEHRGRILFVDAKNDYFREGAQSFLAAKHQRRILDAYRNFAEEDGFSVIADLAQIRERQHSLAIQSYVVRSLEATVGDNFTLGRVVTEWRNATIAADTAFIDVLRLLAGGRAQ